MTSCNVPEVEHPSRSMVGMMGLTLLCMGIGNTTVDAQIFEEVYSC